MKTLRLCYSFSVATTGNAVGLTIEDAVRWNLLQRRLQERTALDAFRLFRSHGIEPVLIKGLAAARFYPPSVSRYSVDLDLAVGSTDFRVASQIAASPSAAGLAIDLHREMRHLDRVDWKDLLDNSELLELDGETIRVLRHEDHLRVLCVHWLTDGGVYRERLWDIVYGIQNRAPGFDWTRFLDAAGPRRRRWYVCTLGLARRYLGLDLTDTPVADEALNLPGWLVDAVTRAWNDDRRPLPLHISLNDRALFAKQMRDRLRPDPIWATVAMNGSFDAGTRLHYQIGHFVARAPASIFRIVGALRKKKNA